MEDKKDKKKVAIGGGAILLLGLLAFGAAKVTVPSDLAEEVAAGRLTEEEARRLAEEEARRLAAEAEARRLALLKEQQIYDLVNQSVSLINEAKQAATARDWDKCLSLAQAAANAAHEAEALAETPIAHKALPSLSLGALADSCVSGAAMQSYAAAQTSPSGYAAGGYEYAGDFGYGAGVF